MQTLEPGKYQPGQIVLFGSGETSPQGRNVFDYVLSSLPRPPHIALVETPAGFELNSDRVIGRVRDFLVHHLQNYDPQIRIVPARKRGTYNSPDNPKIMPPLLNADLIFMGPGSPTYAVRQLRESLAWKLCITRHRSGSTLIFSSAATIAIGRCALPVYEIYKVGEDLHWKEGLNLFGMYGLSLIFIPHWNNNDGGFDLDTSRCFMGASRFTTLLGMLPPDTKVVGIDELTALIIEPDCDKCHVIGHGNATLINQGHLKVQDTKIMDHKSSISGEKIEDRSAITRTYKDGEFFNLSEIGPFQTNNIDVRISKDTWTQILDADQVRDRNVLEMDEKVPENVIRLVEIREEARSRKDWVTADKVRENIAGLGWKVVDTPEGPALIKTPE